MIGDRWWVVRGGDPRVTRGAILAAAAVVLCLVALAVWWPPFVFVAFELEIGLVVLAFVAGVLAVRRGGSLLMSVWVVLAPVAAIELLVPLVNGASVSPSRMVEAAGGSLYVGLGTAVPVGLLVYAAGVRSRSGPWEGTLENHLPIRPARVSPAYLAGWAGVVALVPAALSVDLVNLGMAWSVLLLGGSAVAVLAGIRRRDATEAVAVGVVAGAGLGLVSVVGFGANDPDPWVPLALSFVAAVVAGLPLGCLGYLAGRAIEADAAPDDPSGRYLDNIAV